MHNIYRHTHNVNWADNMHNVFITVGVKTLTSLVAVNPRYAADHQETVLDCLEHTDTSIRNKVSQIMGINLSEESVYG